jgi:hypothetical protein
MRPTPMFAVMSVLSLGCAATAPPPTCVDPSAVAALPRWMAPSPEVATAAPVASRTIFVDGGARGTIRITPESTRDPLAEAMGARGRRRIRSMALREAPVTDTLRMFAELGAFNVVFSDETPGRTVTLTLRDVSILGAFRTVLAAAHLGADAPDGGIVSVHPGGPDVATRSRQRGRDPR